MGLASLPARPPYADRNQILKSFFFDDRPTTFATSPLGRPMKLLQRFNDRQSVVHIHMSAVIVVNRLSRRRDLNHSSFGGAPPCFVRRLKLRAPFTKRQRH